MKKQYSVGVLGINAVYIRENPRQVMVAEINHKFPRNKAKRLATRICRLLNGEEVPRKTVPRDRYVLSVTCYSVSVCDYRYYCENVLCFRDGVPRKEAIALAHRIQSLLNGDKL